MADHQVGPQASTSSPLTRVDIEEIKTLAFDSFLSSMLGNITYHSLHGICIPTASEPVQLLSRALNKLTKASLVFAAMKTHLETQAQAGSEHDQVLLLQSVLLYTCLKQPFQTVSNIL